jgi:amino acid adenylation domain-containing protein/non-ribosomal peptide synthase protein (TIGR01720 family)
VLASDRAIGVSLSYWSSSMSEWQVGNVASTFAKILGSIIEGGATTVNELDTFSDRDTKQLLEWNQAVPEVINACVHEVVIQQASMHPDAPAICAWDMNFSYSDLDKSSSRLAHQLRRLGVGPEVMVPLCFEKSAWAVVAMLGILKAGGACVALDPSHPLSRLEGIVRDVNAKVVLAAPSTAHMFLSLVPRVLVITQSFVSKLPFTGKALYCGVRPFNPAFVIYTSGSTGKPKGVVLEHVSVCTSVASHGSALQIGPDSRVLQFAAYVFDISIQDIFTTLMRGGCVCVPSEHERTDNLAAAINKMGVNWACLTPTVAGLLRPSHVPGLQTLTLAGEAVTKKVIDVWAGLESLNNCYGPAESTIYCAWNGRVGKTDSMPSNIGQGLSSILWVVDIGNHNRLAAVSSIGELLIEGPLLARGYLNDPDKTAASFIKDPAWANSKEKGTHRRMYKTGDLVRHNSDGTLDYLGRKDSQVKLHGQRLELGEIEYHLAANKQVERSMVTMAVAGHCRQRLVAVMQFREPSSMSNLKADIVTSNSLQLVDDDCREVVAMQSLRVREHLSRKVPIYMVPAVWILVKAIPLNTSGKLDRAKVARWVEEMDEDTYLHIVDAAVEETVGPTTVMDRQLQGLLSQVLNLPLERVALNKSFLNLGGDSITAMQLVSRARASGINLRVQDILRGKSISQMALVAKLVTQSPLSRTDEVDIMFNLSPIQQMYFHMGGDKANHFHQSFFLRLSRKIRPVEVARAVEAVVRQHSMLRARFTQRDSGKWGQLISKDIGESYRFGLHETTRQEEMTEIMIASQASLSVKRGPVFAAEMFEMESKGQLLFLVAHHLVIDLVSWRVILKDLEELLEYGTLSAAIPFPFQAWCKLQADRAQQYLTPAAVLPYEVVPADYAYWGMADRSNVYGDTVSEKFSLDSDTTSILLGGTQAGLGTEPVDILLATLSHAFGRTFSDRSTPSIFSEGHGREPWDAEIDLSDTVGWFTTMSPLHVEMVRGEDVVETVRHTKDIRRKLPGNGWPYFASRFLNDEGIKEFKTHFPMEVLFNYLGLYQQLEREDALLQPETLPGLVPDVGRDVQRLALFEVSGVVVHGVMQLTIVYNCHIQRKTDVGRWVHMWQQTLQEAVDRLSNMEPERTLSDFPLLSMTYAGLDKLRNERLADFGASFADVEDVYPCTPMQQGLLLSQTRKSGNYEVEFMYEVVSLRIGIPVDVEKLLSAWQQVVDKHPVLRTVFVNSVSKNGVFDQIVLKQYTTKIVREECRGPDTEALAMLYNTKTVKLGESQPPHQLTVYRTKSGSVFYKMEISHAIIDAASITLIQRDLALAYEGALATSPSPLYSDYIKYLSDRPLNMAVDYWKGHLSGLEPCNFPLLQDGLDKPRKLNYKTVNLGLPPDALHTFCRKSGLTMANVMQAVWGLVLRCYTGSDQVCFGYVASGRDIPLEGVDDIVGPFINMLVCRMDIAGSSTVKQLVQQVQEGYLAGLEHQHCSLAQIQHALGLSGKPLFNTLMSIRRVLSPSSSNGQFCSEKSPVIEFKSIGSHDPTEVRVIRPIKMGPS